MSANRAEIVRAVKDIRAAEHLDQAVDLAILLLVQPARAATDAAERENATLKAAIKGQDAEYVALRLEKNGIAADLAATRTALEKAKQIIRDHESGIANLNRVIKHLHAQIEAFHHD